MDSNKRIEMLRVYLAEDPQDEFSRYALALELIKSGNDNEAYGEMEYLIRNNPGYLPAYYHYGKLLERIGETVKAESVFRKGIETANSQKDLKTASELAQALELMNQ